MNISLLILIYLYIYSFQIKSLVLHQMMFQQYLTDYHHTCQEVLWNSVLIQRKRKYIEARNNEQEIWMTSVVIDKNTFINDITDKISTDYTIYKQQSYVSIMKIAYTNYSECPKILFTINIENHTLKPFIYINSTK